jgi:hypothetical protein
MFLRIKRFDNSLDRSLSEIANGNPASLAQKTVCIEHEQF